MFHRALFTLMALAFAWGCAAPAPDRPKSKEFGKKQELSPVGAAVRDRLTHTDNGLEVRRWVVADQPDRITRAVLKYADGLAADELTLRNLKQNGFRFVRVPVENIESLLADLGGATYEATEWHGQVVEWRSLVDRAVEPEGQAVAIDGIVSRFETGEFRLMIRSWNVQMESGPYLHLEMTPRRRLAQPNDLRRLLGEEGDTHQFFASIALDVQLEAGFAYVLASESPSVGWLGLDGDSIAPAPQPTSTPSPTRRNNLDFGPKAAPPSTLGELLLAPPSATKSRGILVLVPSIAPNLFLPEQTAARSLQKTNMNKKSTGA